MIQICGKSKEVNSVGKKKAEGRDQACTVIILGAPEEETITSLCENIIYY